MVTSQAQFGELLQAVTGQAFTAAGYALASDPVQQAGGLYRFEHMAGDVRLSVAYQLLLHEQQPARFQVILMREPVPGGTGRLPAARITLSRLLWDVFQVRVLPAADHWWVAADPRALGDGLLESGKLLFGYGLPWLAGTLHPGDPAG